MHCEVYQVLFNNPTIKWNEVNIFIVQGVHAKVKLKNRVDWSTLKAVDNNVKIPTFVSGLIPQGIQRYSKGGLDKIKKIIDPLDTYVIADSIVDTNSNRGSHSPMSVEP